MPAGASALRAIGAGLAGALVVLAWVPESRWNAVGACAALFGGDLGAAWPGLLAAGALLAIGGGLARGLTAPSLDRPDVRAPLARFEWAGIAAITAVALAARIAHLSEVPPGLWYDEGSNGGEVRDILSGRAYAPYSALNNGQATLYFYLSALPVLVFGEWLGDPVLAIRLTAAAAGAATPLALFLAARPFTGTSPAMLAALMLAFSRWHITFSRIAFMAILTPLAGLLAFHFFHRFARSPAAPAGPESATFVRWARDGVSRHRDAVLAGLLLGLALHIYAAAYFTLAAGAFALAAFASSASWRRGRAASLGWMAAGMALPASMTAGFALLQPDIVFGRSAQVSILAGREASDWAAALSTNAKATLLMFHRAGDANPRHNLPGSPMFEAWTALALAAGFGAALFQLHRPLHRLAAVWLPLALLPGVLTIEAPQALRCLGALAPAYLLVACALEPILDVARALGGAAARLAAAAALLAVAASIGSDEAARYAQVQMRDPRVWDSFSTVIASIARRAMEAPREAIVIADYADDAVFRYLTLDRRPAQAFDPLEDIPFRGSLGGASGRVVYLLAPFQAPVLDELRAAYPSAPLRAHLSPAGTLVHYSLEAGSNEVGSARGLRARRPPDGPARIERRLLASADPGPGEREWSGLLYVPESGHYRFFRHEEAEGSIELDGRPVALLSPPPTPDTTASSEALATPTAVATAASGALPSSTATPEGAVSLVKGMHPFRLVLTRVPDRPRSALTQLPHVLQWQFLTAAPPESIRTTVPREPAPVPEGYTAPGPLPDRGFGAEYWRGDEPEGTAAFWKIDPAIAFRWERDPLPERPWCVRWRGRLRVDTGGEHLFFVSTNDRARLVVDGEKLAEVLCESVYGEETGEASRMLTQGMHRIELTYWERKNYSRIRLQWRPPGTPVSRTIGPESVAPIFPWADAGTP